ncbi:MAG: DUF6474 family protein [Nakamurella sp.]
MFGRKKSASTRAAKKADKAAEKAQKKATRAADKAAEKGTGKATAVAKRADRKAAKAAAKIAPKSLFDRVTDPKSARRAMSAAKIVGPALAPFALKAATSTRDYLDNRKAAKLGVSPEEVGAFRGPTGTTEARLQGLKGSIAELRARRAGDLQVTRFSDVAATRIADLTTAVRAATTMPAGRRRVTLSAVNKELDQIDADLMTFLVTR